MTFRLFKNEIEDMTEFFLKKKYKIEILYEIDEKNEKDFIYINDDCDYNRLDETTHKIKRIIKGDKGKKLILIEDLFRDFHIWRIDICLKGFKNGIEPDNKVKS